MWVAKHIVDTHPQPPSPQTVGDDGGETMRVEQHFGAALTRNFLADGFSR